MNTHIAADLVWVRTDSNGQIEGLSRAARELLGVTRARGQNLLLFFPVHSREMAFDMEVALTGWPSRRMATLEREARQRLTVRYTVSTGLTFDAVGLYWFFEVLEVRAVDRVH